MSNKIAMVFEYGMLDSESAEAKLTAIANDLRGRSEELMSLLYDARAIFEEAACLPLFRPWVEQEVGISRQHAHKLVIAHQFEQEHHVDAEGQVGINAKYLLGSQDTPTKAVKEAVAKLTKHGRLSEAEAKSIVDKHKKSRAAGTYAQKTITLESPCPRCDANRWVEDKKTERMKCLQCNYLYGDPTDEAAEEGEQPRRRQAKASFQRINTLAIDLLKEMSEMNFILAGERAEWPQYAKVDKYHKAMMTSIEGWEKRANKENEQ